MHRNFYFYLKIKLMKQFVIFTFVFVFIYGCQPNPNKDTSIKPCGENSWYWQYKGKPVMLLGASSDDNLFQWPSEMLIPHLDSMKQIGANYVRCTMSDRQDRGFELYPFAKNESGKYDLEKLNPEYFERFKFFLEETSKRDIIIQIEVWDRFDYSRNHWPVHPYNPQNNINYSVDESGLATDYPDHPGRNVQPFFFTTPHQRDNQLLLKYQKVRVEKILEVAFNFNNVLYCIDNETSGEEEWATYWASYISTIAKEAGKGIHLTQMWDAWDLTSEQHKRTFDHPERYSFCDVSQNNQKKGQEHWDNFQSVRRYISSQPRPMNTVKTYGADGGRHGTTKNAIERWWRHVLGGAASARFHRPPSGLGLSEFSVNCVKIARDIEQNVRFWELKPRNELLSDCDKNEAYLVGKLNQIFVLFFTDGGEVRLDLNNEKANYKLQWYNIRSGEKHSEKEIGGGESIKLKTPANLEWLAVIFKK